MRDRDKRPLSHRNDRNRMLWAFILRMCLCMSLCLCISVFPEDEALAAEEELAYEASAAEGELEGSVSDMPDAEKASGPSAEGWVQDGAGLLTESEEAKLEERCGEILSEYGISAVIITTDRFEGSDILDWERRLFAEQGLGTGENNSSLILGISMAERDWGITAYGDGERIFGAYVRETIGGEILDDLSDGDYYDAFDIYLDMADTFMADAREGKFYSESNHYRKRMNPAVVILGAAVLSFIVSLLVVLSWKRGMNTRVLQDSAGAYLMQGSFRLTNRADIFLYHTVNRSRRQKQENHSSGSMHSSGNGTRGKF